MLKKKIDFMAVVTVENANPNGDPLNGNRPRQDFENYGLITPVCIKRKLRNRLQDMGRRILVQQDDRSDDGYTNLSDRLDSVPGFDALSKDKKQTAEDAIPILCQTFEDVRAFGTVVAMKKTSIGIRGPVTIQMGKSVSPVDVESMQITKSVSNEPGEKRGSDTMGMTHVIPFGIYLVKGSINPILSEKTGLTEQDVADIKEALRTMFVNDESAARPAGSMTVYRLFWWEQDADNIHYSTRQLMDTVRIQMKDPDAVPKSIGDYDLTVTPLPDVPMEEIEGV